MAWNLQEVDSNSWFWSYITKIFRALDFKWCEYKTRNIERAAFSCNSSREVQIIQELLVTDLDNKSLKNNKYCSRIFTEVSSEITKNKKKNEKL